MTVEESIATANGQTEELRQQFHIFDVNGSGFIERDELKESLTTLGYLISDERLHHLFTLVGSTDDRFNFEQFSRWNRQLFHQDLKAEFEAIDTDHSGWISKSELREYSKQMNYGLTEEQIEDFLYEADENGNDRVGLDEYIATIAATKTGKAYFHLNAEMYVAKLKEDFRDLDVDGNGVVTREDLLQKAKDIHYFLSQEELESTIQSMDEDGDGKISLEEFVASAMSKEDMSRLDT